MTATALADRVRTPHRLGWSGMVWLILTEAVLFGFLIFSYFYLGAFQPSWPPAVPPLSISAINTLVLIASSGTMAMAEWASRRRRTSWTRGGLLATLLLGLVFLLIQGFELTAMPISPTRNAYGSLVFTILGFHAVHVLAGVVMNAAVQCHLWLGTSGEKRHPGMESISLYWHFVDAVWIVIFSCLYLAPRLL
jgi:heme/copper-type cytochrome/quinol oxidase subunit 3